MPLPKRADRDEVAELADHWPAAFLACRNYGHQWAPLRAVINARGWVDVRELCPRCTSERSYEMSPRGRVYGHPSIDYAEGYLASGLGRIQGEAKEAVRAGSIRRLFEDVRLLSEAESRLAGPPRHKATREALGDEAPAATPRKAV